MDVANGQVEQSDWADISITFAILSCIASVLFIAFAIATNGRGSLDLLSILAPASWVIGTLSLVTGGRAVRNPIVLLAVAGYAVAFVLPAVDGSQSNIYGYIAFFAGWVVVPLAWLANPALVAALILERLDHPGGAAIVALIGMLLALTTLGMAWNGSTPGLGFGLWAVAPGLVALGCALEPSTKPSTREATEPPPVSIT